MLKSFPMFYLHSFPMHLAYLFYVKTFSKQFVISIPKIFWRFSRGISFNPFLVNVPISYPLKTRKSHSFSVVFKAYKMRTMARNGLIKIGDFVIRHTLFILSFQLLYFIVFFCYFLSDHVWPLKNEA